jgi:hypothetical protein
MNEADLRSLINDIVLVVGSSRLPVEDRRAVLTIAETHDLDVWLCESCGETEEEGLACYEILRHTRRREGSATILCSTCADKVPHGRVLSD